MSTTIYTDDDEEVQLPTRKIVCPRCDGEGTHDCFDGGMTASEMDEQGPDFFDDYMGGMYSTECTECNGLRVVDEVDRDRCTPEQLAAFDEQERERWECDAMQRAEIAAGA